MIKKLIILAAALQFALSAAAQPFLNLPSLFSDGMVLQADDMVTIWGWCDPNTPVTVETSWGEKAITKSDFSTLWKVRLKTPKASFDPASFTVSTKRHPGVTVKDILFGQVWLCTGQSNMNWSAAHGIKDVEMVAENKAIRLFTVPKKASQNPQDDVCGKWSACEGDASKWFSAVGLFFGTRLAAELNQPIGLINASWGGTPVELWTPKEKMETNLAMVQGWKSLPYGTRQGWDIGSAYNAMIAPIANFAAAGAIWYQGESNRRNASLYAEEFSLMIAAWREAFGRELPFYFVQIAPKDYNGADDQGALVREQQDMVARSVAKTGMVNISDAVDDIKNIHPKDKRPVGERLAAYALAEVYGKEIGKYKSPRYASMEVKKNRAIISFEEAEGGLECRDSAIAGLEIGDGTAFYPAQGMIQGDKMVVWSNQVKSPVAVRYCFGLTIGNVFDKAGNPLLPFRTDASAAPKAVSESPAKSAAAAGAVSASAVTVSCPGAEIRTLQDGTVFFLNRKYVATQVPKGLSGLKIASHEAGSNPPQTIEISVSEACTVKILARNNSRTTGALADWNPHPEMKVVYPTNDPAKPGEVILWTRLFAAGEKLSLSVADFAGITVIANEIVLK